MLKFNQIEFIYTEICYNGLKDIRNVNHQKIEYILFLMQYHAIQEREKPLYKHKTYISEGTIEIPYMSYLLKVMPLEPTGYDRHFISGYDHSHRERYLFEIKDYYQRSLTEIEEEVKDIITNKKLDKKYFVHKPYYSKIALLYARFQGHCKAKSGILQFIKEWTVKLYMMFILILLLFCTLSLIIMLLASLSNTPAMGIETYGELLTMTVVYGILGVILMWWWTRPTKYEKENHYDI